MELEDLISTTTIYYICFNILSRRAIRNTLKVRSVLRALKEDILTEPPPDVANEVMTISMIDSITTDPSSKFIGSMQYFMTPNASSLRPISTIKIHVKT
jgi:hypothetical protein